MFEPDEYLYRRQVGRGRRVSLGIATALVVLATYLAIVGNNATLW